MDAEELFYKYQHLAKETLYKVFKTPEKYAKAKHIEYNDLLQYSYTGLWKSCISWNPEKSQFKTYAINHIRWHVNQMIRDECNFKFNKNEGYDENNIVYLFSMEEKIEDADGEEVTNHDLIASDVNVEFDAISNLGKNYILNCLDATQKQILHMLQKGMSYRQIGELWNMTGENVRCKLKKARKQLKNYREVV